MDAVMKMPGKGVARPSSPKGGGLALINATFTPFAQALAISKRCADEVEATGSMNSLAQMDVKNLAANGIVMLTLEETKSVHARMLRNYAGARSAFEALFGVFILGHKVSQRVALKMLSALFGALSTKKADDSDTNPAMRLMACADIFDRTNEIVGDATGLWKPVSGHPLILALAIKRLIATQVFAPSPSEVREAMEEVHQRLNIRTGWTGQWVDAVRNADAIIFACDRAAWDAAYAHVGSDVVLAMRDSLYGEEPSEDDDGNLWPPSPRWQALDDLLKAKKPKRVAAAKKRDEAKRSTKAEKQDADETV